MTVIPQKMVKPVVRDSGKVAETFVNGPINMNIMGNIATLTFTSVRPDVTEAFKGQTTQLSAEVVSRLTMPLDTLVQLREMLSKNIQLQPAPIGSSLQQ